MALWINERHRNYVHQNLVRRGLEHFQLAEPYADDGFFMDKVDDMDDMDDGHKALEDIATLDKL